MAIKLAIGDSQHFNDLITGLNWREGLTIEAMNLIKSHLRVEGKQSLLEERESGLVSFTAARHAAEVVGVMYGFAVSMVRYTMLYQSHLLILEKQNRYTHTNTNCSTSTPLCMRTHIHTHSGPGSERQTCNSSSGWSQSQPSRRGGDQ